LSSVVIVALDRFVQRCEELSDAGEFAIAGNFAGQRETELSVALDWDSEKNWSPSSHCGRRRLPPHRRRRRAARSRPKKLGLM